MHEDGVEVPVGDGAGSLVVTSLVATGADEDVADAAHDPRSLELHRMHGIEQRQQLELELLAPEREEIGRAHV